MWLCFIFRGCGVLPGVDGHSTGHRVPDAGAGPRVGRLHDDEGPFLQSDHPEVLGVVQRLQEGAVTREGMVTKTQVAVLPPADLDWAQTHKRRCSCLQILGDGGSQQTADRISKSKIWQF